MRYFTLHRDLMGARRENTLSYRLIWQDDGFYMHHYNDNADIEENVLYSLCYSGHDPVLAVLSGDVYHCIEDDHWSPEDYIKFHKYVESIGFIEAMKFMAL